MRHWSESGIILWKNYMKYKYLLNPLTFMTSVVLFALLVSTCKTRICHSLLPLCHSNDTVLYLSLTSCLQFPYKDVTDWDRPSLLHFNDDHSHGAHLIVLKISKLSLRTFEDKKLQLICCIAKIKSSWLQ